MKPSENGIKFIASWETFQPVPYDDGYGYMTAGFGHKILAGENFSGGVTEEQGYEILSKDLAIAENEVNRRVTVALYQNEFDALVSLVFNIGTGNFRSSTLLKMLNQDHKSLAADQFLLWKKSAGKESKGLLKRRVAERDIFLNGHYVFEH